MKNLVLTITATSLTIEAFKDNPVIVFIGVMASILLFLNQLYLCVSIINKKHNGNVVNYIKAFKVVQKFRIVHGRKKNKLS